MAFSMSGDVNRDVTITFIGKDNASSAMRSISGTATKTTSIASRLGKTLKYVAAAAATALAAAAAFAAKMLWDATKAAYYDDIAMKKLAFTQMKAQDATAAQTKATSDLIDKLELATGIADDEMRPAMAALAGTGMDVEKSQRLLAVALDVSVARGKSVQTVAEALAKAYNGQTTSLQRLGIKVTDAAGDALSFSEVLAQLKDRFDGAARAAGKTDPLARLEAAWNQMKEEVGAGLLPVLRQFSEWMIREGVPWVKKELVPAIQDLGRWIKRNGSDIQAWLKVLDATWKILGVVVKAVEAVGGAIGWLTQKVKALFNSDTSFFQDMQIGLNILKNPLVAVKSLLAQLALVARTVAAAFQGAINKINELKSTAASIPSSIPQIPGGGPAGWLGGLVAGAFNADGGYVRRGQGGWTMVGEHGPELINNRGFMRPHSASMGAGSSGPTIIIQGAIDPVGTARQIERILAKGGRVMGRGQLATA